jgi:hypothetical protein
MNVWITGIKRRPHDGSAAVALNVNRLAEARRCEKIVAEGADPHCTSRLASITTVRRQTSVGCLCLFFAIAIQRLCCADVTKLPSEDRSVLQDSSRFHEVHSTKDLPPAVVALCADDKGRLADPGQNWNATDAVTDTSLPWKRLIWAAVGGDYYVVHYERGGIDHSFHVLVAKLATSDAKPKVIWSGVGRPLRDYAAFLDALRNGKLDRLDYGH